MRIRRIIALLIAGVFIAPIPAFANCASPLGVAGDQFYNTTYNVMQFCNGTGWINMGVSVNGGIGTLTSGDLCTTDGLNINCTTNVPLLGTNGGTGINNGPNTLTLGGNVTYSGAHTVTWTTTGTTTLTLPTTGTLETTSLASGDIWIGNGSSVATATALPLSVANGGTALSAGTSGGVLYYSGTGTLASSGALTQYEVVLGGGAGAAPYVVSGTGTSGQVLTSTGSSTAPTWQTAGSCVPSGAIMPYAGSSAPSGWLLAYGQCVSTTTYAALYAAIGDTWTSTDGCSGSNFGIPDLRGRAAFGVDNMGGSAANRLGSNSSTGGISGTASLGTSGGAQTHVQTVAELAAHNHGINDPGHSHTASIPGTNVSGEIEVVLGGGYWYNAATITTSNNTTGITIQSTGSSTAFNITPPVMVLSYIIKQ